MSAIILAVFVQINLLASYCFTLIVLTTCPYDFLTVRKMFEWATKIKLRIKSMRLDVPRITTVNDPCGNAVYYIVPTGQHFECTEDRAVWNGKPSHFWTLCWTHYVILASWNNYSCSQWIGWRSVQDYTEKLWVTAV